MTDPLWHHLSVESAAAVFYLSESCDKVCREFICLDLIIFRTEIHSLLRKLLWLVVLPAAGTTFSTYCWGEIISTDFNER